MLDALRTVLLLGFTYLGAPVAIFLCAARVLKTNADGAPRLFALTWGLGPIAISWCLTQLLRVWPGRSDSFYIVAIVLAFALPALAGRREVRLLIALYRKLRTVIRPQSLLELPSASIMMIAAAVGVVLTVLLGVALPMYANDPLEYATLARMLYARKSIAFYPMTEADPEFGFYFPSTHPLGFPSLYAWHYLMQGTADHAGLINLVSPIYAAATCVLVAYILAPVGRVAAAAGAVLLITTPLFHRTAIDCHVDPMRLHTFLLAFLWLSSALRQTTISRTLFLGLATGMSMFSHSIGVVTLPFVGAIYLARAQAPLRRRVLYLGAATAVVLLLTGNRYLDNYRTYGSPVQDNIPLYARCTDLEYDAFLRDHRGIGTPVRQLTHGIFRGWTDRRMFGWTYWIATVGVVLGWKLRRRSEDSDIMLGVIGLFHLLMAVTVAAGVDLIIKNPRYLLTVQPMVVFVGALAIQRLHDFVPPPRLLLRRAAVTVTVVVVCAAESDMDFGFDKFPVLRRPQFATDLDMLAASHEEMGRFALVRRLRDETRPDAMVYTARMSDISFYAERPYIRDFDTRAVPLCSTSTGRQAYELLRQLGVDYVYMTSYKTPMFFRTGVHRALADPRFTRLMGEAGEYRLYEVPTVPRDVIENRLFRQDGFFEDPTWQSGPHGWSVSGHRSRHETAEWSTREIDGRTVLELFTRAGEKTSVYSGEGTGLYTPPQEPHPMALLSGSIHQATASVAGEGYANLRLVEWKRDGTRDITSLWYGALTSAESKIGGQFLASTDTSAYRLAIEHSGPGVLRLFDVEVAAYEENAVPAPDTQS